MTLEELEKYVERLRSRPLVLLCMTPTGKEQKMSVQECMETGSDYIHVAVDDLDLLLSNELRGGRYCD